MREEQKLVLINVIGMLLMLAATFALYLRTGDSFILLLGGIIFIVVVIGAAMR